MSDDRHVDGGWWDAAFQRQGHTGWADPLVYRYDQPVRRASVRGAIDSLATPGRVLDAADIGCGTGDFTLLLARRGMRVLAIDFSAAVLEQARLRAAAAGVSAKFECASATRIPAESGSLDLVTSITVMQHLVRDEDLALGVNELARVLRPDGRVVFLELAPPLSAPNRAPDGHVIERPPQSWQQAFEAGGLVVEREFPYPQVGITALRLFANAIDRARGTHPGAAPAASIGPAADAASAAAAPPSLARRVLRAALAVTRSALLLAAWPLDHLLRLQVPKRQRYYRLWILKKKSQGGH